MAIQKEKEEEEEERVSGRRRWRKRCHVPTSDGIFSNFARCIRSRWVYYRRRFCREEIIIQVVREILVPRIDPCFLVGGKKKVYVAKKKEGRGDEILHCLDSILLLRSRIIFEVSFDTRIKKGFASDTRRIINICLFIVS